MRPQTPDARSRVAGAVSPWRAKSAYGRAIPGSAVDNTALSPLPPPAVLAAPARAAGRPRHLRQSRRAAASARCRTASPVKVLCMWNIIVNIIMKLNVIVDIIMKLNIVDIIMTLNMSPKFIGLRECDFSRKNDVKTT